MRKASLLSLLLFTAAFLAAACESETGEGEGMYYLDAPVALRLPPGHPGYFDTSRNKFILPPYPHPPVVHPANCFAGVEEERDVGIGSALGFTQDYIGEVVLPVNINLGHRELKSYQVKISSGNPAVIFDPSGVRGSDYRLASLDCRMRGCPLSCTIDLYPPQFNRAPGFEHLNGNSVETAPDGSTITIAAVSSDLSQPTTGVVNLCNVKIKIVGPLPAAGVNLNFEVLELFDVNNTDLLPELSANNLKDGIVIERYQLE